jgi:Flp pilus assembly CpaE family ATPase
MAEIMGAIASIFVDPEAEPLGRSIAFIGAKGGVGSSTIAHNCAFGISTLFSTETVLADLDLPFGTANIDFDQDPAQGMAEAVFSPERLDEVFLDRSIGDTITSAAPFSRSSIFCNAVPRSVCSTCPTPGRTGREPCCRMSTRW